MVTKTSIMVEGRSVNLWSGGGGEAIVLVHGAWGGAAMHWDRIWEPLAERFRVVAPELPLLGDPALPGLPSIGAYGRWLESLLCTLEIGEAWLVGNSFGAAVAWSLAAQAPSRCRGLVLVNGGPLELPAAMRQLLGLPPFAQLVRALFRWSSYSPGTLTRAFADPGRAPAALVGVLAGRQGAPPALELLGQLLRAEEPQAGLTPRCPTLLLWGAEDHLPGMSVRTATHLQGRVPAAQLVLIPDAGHLPQAEQPDRFVEALCSFVEARRHLAARP